MTLNESRMQFPTPPALEHPELLSYRDEFPILQQKTYLNSCSLGALSQRSMRNIEEFMYSWNALGAHAWYDIWLGQIASARKKFATLIKAQPHEIAIAPNVSSALSVISSALNYETRNNVVLTDMDFPTLAHQWLVKERQGIECRFVQSPDHITVPVEAFEEKVDEQTAVVATSRVFYTSGYIQDIRSIADIAHKNGAYMLVDDYQATGQIPLDVVAADIDILVTGTLKWLLGGPGLAFIYIREGLIPSLEPTIAGWFGHRDQFDFPERAFVFRADAARLEMGTPAIASIYAAHGGLDIVQEVSVESICERSRYLTNDLVARAHEKGWTVRIPDMPELRNSIVLLELDDPPTIVRELLERDIIVDSRPGLLRVSPYFYNTIEENAVLIDALDDILRKRH